MRRGLAVVLAAVLLCSCLPQAGAPGASTIEERTVVVKETVVVRQTVVSIVTATPLPASPTPRMTNTPAPTNTPVPTKAPPQGAFQNPVALGADYTFPGLGSLRANRTLWQPGQTGYAIVELSFRCERPAGQECDVGDFMLDAVGCSGNGYDREFDSAIPDPTFGSFANPPVYGGGTEEGFAGFLITKAEESLLMRVRLFLGEGEVFFAISE